MKLPQVLPIAGWLPKYSKNDFKGDLSAGLTVGVMLIPQGMAYAMIAGLPPIYGLYASTIPILIYALFGTSRQLAVGPVAMVSLLTAAGVGQLAEGGTEAYIQLAVTVAFLVGAIQFLLGVFRMGFLVNFLSHPVISGFTSAAALIIGISQLKHLMGVKLPQSHYIHEILIAAVQKAGETQLSTLAIALTGIALILGIRRFNKAIPGQLLAVVFGVLVVWLFGLDQQGVKIVGEVPKGLPNLSLPTFSLETWSALIPTALTIALVSFMESIAVAKAIQSKHKNYKVEPNQELIGLGLANLGGSFFQSYPTTGGFSRTAVNDQAGAKTTLASIISVALIVLTLLFLTPLFYYLPNAILSSVIMVAVFGLIDFKEPIHLWHSNRTDFAMLVVTFLATLSLGIEQGIAVGVVLSLVMVIFRTTRPHVAILGKVPGTGIYRNIERFGEVEQRPDILILRFDAQLYFANLNYFRDTIDEWTAKKGKDLRLIIINGESINYADSSAVHTLHDILEDSRKRNSEWYFAGVKGPVRDAFAKGDLTKFVGEENFFLTVQDAVDHHDLGSTQEEQVKRRTLAIQTNK
ncbi:MAG: solute carrier family 26 protein [Saprospirales bacterium]|nr:solute carrier family 26 protein [Saprospirales bacterium]